MGVSSGNGGNGSVRESDSDNGRLEFRGEDVEFSWEKRCSPRLSAGALEEERRGELEDTVVDGDMEAV